MPSIHGATESGAGWLAAAVEQIQAEAPDAAASEDHLRIAGHEVRVRYAELELAEALRRATRHLRIADRSVAALTVDCWTAPNPPPFVPVEQTTGVTYVDDGDVVLTWDAAGRQFLAYDRVRQHAWARFDSLAGISTWEPAAPFRRILNWWAADHGLQWVHAAAVGRPTGGVLLVGRSGSGKSTTALACLEAGLAFVGEDACLLESSEPSWVHGLYVSAKGDARTASLLPAFRDEFAHSTLRAEGESIVFADELRPGAIATGFPLRGIIIPRLTGGTNSSLSPVGSAAALRALAPSTLLQMPGNRAYGLGRLAATVRNLPAWELTLGTDPAEAAALIRELLDGQLSR